MITNTIILICVLVYAYLRFYLKDTSVYGAMKMGALVPEQVTEKHEYWRIITANFIHIDFFHLLINMYCIYQLGHFLEMILGIYYIGLILASALFTGFVSYVSSFYFKHLERTVSLGASGIFFGYLGAIIGMALFNGGIYMQILSQSIYMIIINIAFTLFMPGISKSGHFGGLLGGYFFSFVLTYLVG